MLRTVVTLVVLLPTLWLATYVFSWIVTGDVEIPGLKVNREANGIRFWATIVALALLCCILFGVAIALFLGMMLPGRFER